MEPNKEDKKNDDLGLNQLVKKYDIDTKKNVKYRRVNRHMYMLGILGIFLVLSILVLFKQTDTEDYKFKSISTNCHGFKVTASIDYDKVTSSIYITNINYCGGNDKTVYDTVKCSLYENGDTNTKINDFNLKNKVSLEYYLKNLHFNFDDYRDKCQSYTDKSLYLEVTTKKDEKENTYKIPLSLNNSCPRN